jgi:hypothetical protein
MLRPEVGRGSRSTLGRSGETLGPTKATAEPKKAAVTCFANRLSHRYGFGCEPENADLLVDPVCQELGIDQAWIDQTDRPAPGLADVTKKILG